MANLDRFNPAEEAQRGEAVDVYKKAHIENAEKFSKLLENETDPEQIKDLEMAIRVAEAVKEKGGVALVVGGFARDVALRKFGYELKPKDIDIEVYGIEPERLKEILESLGKVDLVGAQFEVMKLKGLDISIPRRDSKTGKGHKGFTVEGDPNMTIREAAQRRDFTINALALDPLTGEILDFYGGIEDIQNKILRATDDKLFGDDTLRVLRGAQFAGRFGFNIDSNTAEICRSLDLTELPKERVGEEWLKLLMKSEKPSVGLKAMLELGVLDKLHPEVRAIVDVPQNPEYHPEGDVWVHTGLVVDAAVQVAKENNLDKEKKLILMLSALCHDLGKAVTTKIEEDGKITSYRHETEGLPLANHFLESLSIGRDLVDRILLLIQYHMRIHNDVEFSDSAVRRLSNNLYPASIRELAWLATADTRGTTKIEFDKEYPAAEALIKKAEELAVKDSKPKPLIMGRDLLEIGFKPGPKVGSVLKEILELQLDGKIINPEQAKDYARISLHTIELQNFGLPGLEGRIQRGLDPAGMLAVKETRKIIESILSEAGIDIDAVEALTRELHMGAIWKRADDLAKAKKPEVKAWLLLANECQEVNDGDLTPEEYLKDCDRIKNNLKLSEENPKSALDKAVENIVTTAADKFIKKDGVPFSQEDAFLHMAIAGEKYGVCKAGELYFVGADKLDYSILEKEGLVSVEKEDRGQITTFYQKDGKDVVKIKNPGYAIVFGDEELALKLAKSANKFIQN